MQVEYRLFSNVQVQRFLALQNSWIFVLDKIFYYITFG